MEQSYPDVRLPPEMVDLTFDHDHLTHIHLDGLRKGDVFVEDTWPYLIGRLLDDPVEGVVLGNHKHYSCRVQPLIIRYRTVLDDESLGVTEFSEVPSFGQCSLSLYKLDDYAVEKLTPYFPVLDSIVLRD